jgi:hypothetical protein
MRYIKTYKLFESVEETSNWISEVMNTCKDLMLDLEDVGIETDVKKSVHLDKLDKFVLKLMVFYMVLSYIKMDMWINYLINH